MSGETSQWSLVAGRPRPIADRSPLVISPLNYGSGYVRWLFIAPTVVVMDDGCASSRTEETHRAAFHTLGQEARFAAPPGERTGPGRVAITVAAWTGC